MSFDRKIVECCNQLESTRVTVRKAGFEDLRNYLQDPNYVAHLNKNSHSKSKSNLWNQLFLAIHSSLLKEVTEQGRGNKAFNLKQNVSILLDLSKKANGDEARLSCRDVLSCILEAVETPQNRSFFSEGYTNILLDCIFCHKKYCGEINLEQWIDLMNICLVIMEETQSEKVKLTLASCLNYICLHGSHLSGFLVHIHKFLKRLPPLIKDVVASKSFLLQANVIQLSLTVCEQIKKEFRFSVCKFGEAAFPDIIKLYEARDAFKRKELLAKLLTLIVEAHNPCGVPAKSPGALAHSWDLWNDHLKSLYRCLESEIHSPADSKNVAATSVTHYLAVIVAKQVFDENSSKEFGSQESVEYTFEPLNKKRKLDIGVDCVISDIRSKSNISDIWPLLSFLENLIYKYPELFSEENYINMLEITTERLPTCNVHIVTKHLCRLAIQLIYLENILKDKLTNYTKKINSCWSLIWTSALSFLQFSKKIGMKQPNEETHPLVQAMIKKEVSPAICDPLLKLYINNAIPFSSEPLKTFLILCQQVIIPETPEVRKSLLEWIIRGRELDDCSLAIPSAQIAFALILKSKLPYEEESVEPSLNNESELYFIATSLETPPLVQRPHFKGKSSTCVIEYQTCCEQFLKLLKEREEDFFVMKDPLSLLFHNTFLLVLTRLASKHKLTCVNALKNLLNTSLDLLWPSITNEFVECREEVMAEFLVAVNGFFSEVVKNPEYLSGRKVDNMCKHLCVFFIHQYKSSKGSGFITISQQFANDEIADMENVDSEEIPIVLINSLKLILKFAEITGVCENDYSIENYLFEMCTDKIDLSSIKGFKIGVMILKTILNRQKIPGEILNEVLSLLRQLFKFWYQHHEQCIIILQTLSGCVEHIYNYSNQDLQINLCDLIKACSKVIMVKKRYGPMVISFLVQVMISMVKADVTYRWKIEFGACDIKLPTALHILEFFKSPFNEVRFKALEFIPITFKNESISDDLLEIQTEAYSRLEESVSNLFTVKGELSAEDVEEESMKRSSCALKIITTLITHSSFWRRKALYTLFKFITSKNIKDALCKRVLKLIEVDLNLSNVMTFIEQNLDYIVSCWYGEFKHFRDFPFGILGCSSRQDFYSEYKKFLVPVILENRDLETFSYLSEQTEISQVDLVKECFPELMSCLLPKFTPNPQKATLAMHAILVKLIGNDAFTELLSSEYEKVLVCIFQKLHDSSHFNKLCTNAHSVSFPDETSSHISYSGINTALAYLQKTSDGDKPLLVELGLHYSSHIHSMMHTLLANIFEASSNEIRALYFLQYISFCDELIVHIIEIENVGGYVIRSVIHLLLHLTKTELAIPALNYMYRILTLSLPCRASIIDDLLPHIVPVLVSIIKNDEAKGEVALRILEYIIIENKTVLNAIKNLDPIPNNPKFLAFKDFTNEMSKRSLKKEINQFLKAGRHNLDPSFRAEGLEHLNQQLIQRKNELSKLYEELKSSRGFSEDCNKSLLHQLIVSLVKLTTCENSEISIAAARCLGEIGPCDLTTLVLKPQLAEKAPSLPSTVISLLMPLMVHKNPEISASVSLVLQSLLATKEGFKANESLNSVEKTYLTPFCSGRKNKKPYSRDISEELLEESIDHWCPLHELTHQEWIITLTSSLLSSFSEENSFLKLLIPVIDEETSVAEVLLPYLVHKMLTSKSKLTVKIEEKINMFFEYHFKLSQRSTTGDGNKSLIYWNRASVQVMLEAINFYRKKEATSKNKLEKSLKLNYLHVAQAAQFCKAYFTSVMYAELWTEQILSNVVTKDPFCCLSRMEIICACKPDEATILQNLLWEAYKEIGEPDAVYGCRDVHLISREGRIKYFSQMGLWQQVIEECDLSEDINYNIELAYALRMSGNYSSAIQVSHNKTDYECAWRLCNWSLDHAKEDDYSGSLYGALKAIKNKDVSTACQLVDKARNLVIESLAHASLEAAYSIYQPLSRLRVLRELEVFGCDKLNEVRWPVENGRWEDWEPIYYQRGVLIESDALPHIWLNTAEQATKSNALLVAKRCLANIERLSPNKATKDIVTLKTAQLAWKSGTNPQAKYLIKNLLDSKNQTQSSTLSEALLTYGMWMDESLSESPHVIIEKYFEKAAQISEVNKKERHAAAECLAHYADSEYKRLYQYLHSSEYSSKEENRLISTKRYKEFQEKVDSLASQDQKRALILYKVQSDIDSKESINLKKRLIAYLLLAVREYIICLRIGDGQSNDLKMFRLVSLWLNNIHQKALQNDLDENIHKIPSHKFLNVFPQLAVRVSDESTHFSNILNKLLLRCCTEHPHHTLTIILALANSNKDDDFLNPSVGTSRTSKKFKKLEVDVKPRVKGAIILREKLLKNKSIGEMVAKLQELSVAYISLANCPIPPQTRPGNYKIPSNEPIRKIKNLEFVSCLSVSQPVDVSGNYSNIIGIKGFEEIYTLVGGINQPKKIRCICTDGSSRNQLVKGKDDLRQDAVMQQVFNVMNILLNNNENTAKRKLLIRTYKVVPLSQRSGLIDWVDNTEPIAQYLNEAHKKYHPKDLSPNECRSKMNDVASKGNEEKFKTFKEVCSKFKPVFRHFFTEKYPIPSYWFERRLAYTRSVATNSMIGYILGIGDRHVANILVDLITAEVIHIDFGIAFEQALILPTPETVPFRLTRDIIDGMGVMGVEGVFRRCCEETLTVLRKCQEPIITTLEVLLYDPLYTWTMTPKKAQKTQPDSNQSPTDSSSDTEDKITAEEESTEINTLAMRALQRLKQKLQGSEEGGPIGVEGQVNMLINSAKDPENLCKLFRGWQAYF